MKKGLIVLLVLALSAFSAFAAITTFGEFMTTVGYDFTTGQGGFVNTPNAVFSVGLAGATKGSKGEGNAYAEISVDLALRTAFGTLSLADGGANAESVRNAFYAPSGWVGLGDNMQYKFVLNYARVVAGDFVVAIDEDGYYADYAHGFEKDYRDPNNVSWYTKNFEMLDYVDGQICLDNAVPGITVTYKDFLTLGVGLMGNAALDYEADNGDKTIINWNVSLEARDVEIAEGLKFSAGVAFEKYFNELFEGTDRDENGKPVDLYNLLFNAKIAYESEVFDLSAAADVKHSDEEDEEWATEFALSAAYKGLVNLTFDAWYLDNAVVDDVNGFFYTNEIPYSSSTYEADVGLLDNWNYNVTNDAGKYDNVLSFRFAAEYDGYTFTTTLKDVLKKFQVVYDVAKSVGKYDLEFNFHAYEDAREGGDYFAETFIVKRNFDKYVDYVEADIMTEYLSSGDFAFSAWFAAATTKLVNNCTIIASWYLPGYGYGGLFPYYYCLDGDHVTEGGVLGQFALGCRVEF